MVNLWTKLKLKLEYYSINHGKKTIISLTILIIIAILFFISHDFGYLDYPFGKSQIELNQYTIRVNSFRRNDLLEKFLNHYTKCSHVKEITVVWSDQEHAPPSNLLKQFTKLSSSSDSSSAKVSFEVHSTNSLNNRFLALHDVATEGVLSIDDDLIVDCESLRFAHSVWLSHTDSLVGFSPRLAIPYESFEIDDDDIHGHDITGDNKKKERDDDDEDDDDKKRRKLKSKDQIEPVVPDTTASPQYLRWQHTWWNGRYSIILTKIAFMHKKYLSRYHEMVPKSLLDYIDDHRNCEDIAMAYVIATSGNAPLWVKAGHGGVWEEAAAGISSGVTHFEDRSKCLSVIDDSLGRGWPWQLAGVKVGDISSSSIFSHSLRVDPSGL